MTEDIKQPETSTSNCKCQLLTNIAIIIILSVLILSFLAPRLNLRYEPVSHRRISCINNLKQVGLGLMLYADQNNNMFPNGKNIEAFCQVNNLLKYPAIFCCPKSSQSPCKRKEKLTKENISYVYLSQNFENISSLASKNPIVFDYPLNHKKSTGWFSKPEHYINVLFCDGHVEPFKTGAKTCVEFIEVLHKKFKYSPEILKLLKEKAAQADREQVPHKK